MILKRIFISIILFLSFLTITKADNFFLVDTSNFYQLTQDERILISEYLNKLKTVNDSEKVILLNELYNNMNDNDVWVEYLRLMKKTITHGNIKDSTYIKRSLANYYHDYAYYFDYKGQMDSSLNNYLKAYHFLEEIKDTISMVATLRSTGAIYSFLGLYEQSLKSLDKALGYSRLVNDSSEMGYILLIMGKINIDVNEAKKGLEFLYESMQIRKNLNDKKQLAINYNDIGTYLTNHTDSIEKGMEFLRKSIQLAKSTNNSRQQAVAANNIGSYYFSIHEFDSALFYQNLAKVIMEQNHITHGYITTLSNIGKAYYELNKLEKAEEFGLISYQFAKKNQTADLLAGPAKLLYVINKQKNQYDKALGFYEEFVEARDKVKNESNQKAAIRQQTKYEFEKEQLVKEQQEKEILRLQEQKTQRRNNLQYSIILVTILLVFGGILALGKINVSPKFAEGLIFFAFLIFFEFCLVLLDPYVEQYSGGEPAYKLLFNAVLAAGIFPLHAFFENNLKKRIIKNQLPH